MPAVDLYDFFDSGPFVICEYGETLRWSQLEPQLVSVLAAPQIRAPVSEDALRAAQPITIRATQFRKPKKVGVKAGIDKNNG